MTEIAWVFGTRPELVKIAPVVRALRQRGVAQRLLATGQHKDLLDPVLLAELGDVESLGLASDGSVVRFLADARDRLRGVFDGRKPAVVAVQGDTMSAFAGASIARSLGVPIAHVEAGVRSGNKENPWPEEMIRREIDAWAWLRYAPTAQAAQNLEREGFACIVTGNTSVDNLHAAGVVPRREDGALVLVTLHRRELRQRDDVRTLLQAALDAMRATAATFVWPVHPGMHDALQGLAVPGNVHLRPPFSYRALLDVLAGARGVLTDSGGLVEEAATLGVPTVILRDANDRPEACEAGIALQVAPSVNIQASVEALALGVIAERRPCAVYGDGRAGERIAEHLAQILQAS
jgi:UDP-N-acetylglucosamine 2-epimerase (non-hydrolysing)